MDTDNKKFLEYIQEHLAKVTKHDDNCMPNEELFEWLVGEDIERLAGTFIRNPFTGSLDSGEQIKAYPSADSEVRHLGDITLVVEIGNDSFIVTGTYDAIAGEYEFYDDFEKVKKVEVEQAISKTVTKYEKI